MPDNQGERRECLIILEKVGYAQGLLDCLASDKEVSFLFLKLRHNQLIYLFVRTFL